VVRARCSELTGRRRRTSGVAAHPNPPRGTQAQRGNPVGVWPKPVDGPLARKHDPRTLPQRDPTIFDPEKDPAKIEADRISIGREKEADAWSAQWLLEGLDPKDDRFLKRVIGTSLGYLWSATRNIHTGFWLTNNHPPAWDRLYQNLKQYVHTDTHPVWLFAAYILQLHLQAIRRDPSVDAVDSGEKWVNILLDKVSKSKQ
jgi:hypothetical protein